MADGVQFQEAIDFLKAKTNLPTRRWDDLRHGAHAHAFSVAGVTREDMLADFRAAIEKARVEGTGFKEFQSDFNAIVDRTGWKFYSRGGDEEERRAWRARIIYTTNMRTSYMAGRYAQLMDPDVLKYRPYWEYIHSGALHPRKQHLAWNGLVLAATNPAWRIMFPPNGWGCGCDVEALSERQLRALGKEGPDPTPDLGGYQSTDPRTGEAETRYPGIDRGWEYNVGEEWLDGMVPPQLSKPLPAGRSAQPAVSQPMPKPSPVEAAELLSDDVPAPAYSKAFLDAFDLKNDRGIYRDRAGGIITLAPALFDQDVASTDQRFAALLATAVTKPDEIWADWVSTLSGMILRRAYLRNVRLPNGQVVLLRVDWSKAGWFWQVDVDRLDASLNALRQGALLYRRKD